MKRNNGYWLLKIIGLIVAFSVITTAIGSMEFITTFMDEMVIKYPQYERLFYFLPLSLLILSLTGGMFIYFKSYNYFPYQFRDLESRLNCLFNAEKLKQIGIEVNGDGTAIGYKITDKNGLSPFAWKFTYPKRNRIDYANNEVFESKIDSNRKELCSYGINLGTLAWCKKRLYINDLPKLMNWFLNKVENGRIYKMQFKIDDAVIPDETDGRFRVSQCIKIGEIDDR